MALKTLYHGTDIESAKLICSTRDIDVKAGSNKTDFGQGFYTTDDFERAVKWAKRKAFVRYSKAAVVTVVFDEEEAKPIIEYFSDDIRWGRFVINNRNGQQYANKVPFKDNNLDARYEITCGRIADVDVVDIADELKQKNEMLTSIEKILNKEYPIQFAFHTDDSLKYIKKLSYRNI